MRTAKTLIRLGGCSGRCESSLGAHSFCWFCHIAAHLVIPDFSAPLPFPEGDFEPLLPTLVLLIVGRILDLGIEADTAETELCCGSLLFLLSVFILWFSYYVSDIFCKF